jgi:hypothetical protein
MTRYQSTAAERRGIKPAEKEIQGLPHQAFTCRFCLGADQRRPPVPPKCLKRIFVAIDRTSKAVFCRVAPTGQMGRRGRVFTARARQATV